MNLRTFEYTTSASIGTGEVAIFARERDEENGNPKTRIDIRDRDPYILVPEEEAEKAHHIDDVKEVKTGFQTIERRDAAKVIYDRPGATRDIRSKFSQTWESDIPFTKRVQRDADIREVFQIPDAALERRGRNHYEVSWTSPIEQEEMDTEVDKRNFYFDIEVANEGGFVDPMEVDEFYPEITCITAYENWDDRLISWVWRDDLESEQEREVYENPVSGDLVPWEIRKFDSETKMLSNLFDHFTQTGYDIISSWNGDGYDLPAVMRRADYLGLNPGAWSEIGQVNDGVDGWGQPRIEGVWMNDLQRRYDKLEDPQSSKLENVAREEVGMEWEQHSGSIMELWEDNLDLMLEYNANDVIATMEIDRETGVTDEFMSRSFITGAPDSEVEQATKVIDTHMLFTRTEKEFLPKKTSSDASEIGGGKVFNPETSGVLDNIAVLDLSKIYPSIIISACLSYENYAGRNMVQVNEPLTVIDGDEDDSDVRSSISREYEAGDVIDPGDLYKKGRLDMWEKLYDVQSDGTPTRSIDWEFTDVGQNGFAREGDEITEFPNGVKVRTDNQGLLARTLKEAFEIRERYERLLEELSKDNENYKELYEFYDSRKSNAKRQVNAFYGYLLYSNARLFQQQLAECVTFIGRNLLKVCKKVVEEKFGYEVVYGDTDSVMIQIDDDAEQEEIVEIGKEVGEYVNNAMDDFAENFCGFDSDDHMFQIEFEKLYAKMFIGDARKKYAGLKVWDEDGGYIDPYVDITGFEYVRGDSQNITGELQESLFNVLLREGERERAIEVVEDYYNDVINGNVPIRDAVQAPSIQKWSSAWHCRAANFTNDFFDDVNIELGDKVYIAYVETTGYNHNHKKLPENTKYIGLSEDMEPPAAKCQCDECGHEWWQNDFVEHIEGCEECKSRDITVDGCRVDWEKLANKAIRGKAKSVLEHLGWEKDIEGIGKNSMSAFL